MPHDFNAALQAAEKEFNIGKGDGKFKFQEGDNRIRILTEFAVLVNEYQGQTSKKFLRFIWDYGTSRVKLAFLPYTIEKQIAALAGSDEYATNELPMPYDLIVKAKNAGTKEVDYQVVPARNNSEVPAEALTQLTKEKPIKEVRDMIAALQSPSADTKHSTDEIPV